MTCVPETPNDPALCVRRLLILSRFVAPGWTCAKPKTVLGADSTQLPAPAEEPPAAPADVPAGVLGDVSRDASGDAPANGSAPLG